MRVDSSVKGESNLGGGTWFLGGGATGGGAAPLPGALLHLLACLRLHQHITSAETAKQAAQCLPQVCIVHTTRRR